MSHDDKSTRERWTQLESLRENASLQFRFEAGITAFLKILNKITTLKQKLSRRRHRLKGIHSRSDTNRTGAEGLSFYYHRLLYCLDQMLAVMSLSQHRVSSSKTIRPRAPCGADV